MRDKEQLEEKKITLTFRNPSCLIRRPTCQSINNLRSMVEQPNRKVPLSNCHEHTYSSYNKAGAKCVKRRCHLKTDNISEASLDFVKNLIMHSRSVTTLFNAIAWQIYSMQKNNAIINRTKYFQVKKSYRTTQLS